MIRIGVLADTHDWLPDAVVKCFSEVDEIWHLGDVCKAKILLPLEDKPIHVVRGNCDSSCQWPHVLDLTRENVRFFLVHVPPKQAPEGVDVVVHGHTHTPRDEMVKGVRFLNPGSISKPRDSQASFGILELESGAMTSWKIVTF